MNTLFEYMIKISACYAAAYIFYWLVLRRLTHYKSNRFYLLFTSLLAFIIPLLRLDFFIDPQTIIDSKFINHIPALNITAAANEYVPAENSVTISCNAVEIFIIGSCCLSFTFFNAVDFF